ncbi:MAG: RagB/SusD family nutrient uptake outer membrane protein [Porphyromonadaceae bacterium]|jgi:hypothetical protein|nr:RagB/SusD family nutrient uptake outer membrane protein [Porphyromonadaceae bacterium]
MKRSKIYIYILVFALTFGFTSCDNYLDVIPENEQNSSSYWETKEEVQAVLAAGYVSLRSAQERLFLWGEARGNGITFLGYSNDLQYSAQRVRSLDILLNNNLAEWGDIYKIINMANSVIKYAPDVVNRDESFNVNVMNSLLTEAYFLRALSYFYLVRTFGDVPYVVEPYVDDEAPYIIAASDANEILNSSLKDLSANLEAAKVFFPEADFSNPMNTKGRATKWAIHALMADIHLWLGNYRECIDNCEKIINSGRVGLIQEMFWFTNFFPGNSNESIFEIQYSRNLSQTNSFLTWFSGNKNYLISPYQVLLYDDENDSRGVNASYKESDLTIWKYIGKLADGQTARQSGTDNDQNFIIYRLADIYLMAAESYIMLGTEEDFTTAAEYINLIRLRSGIAEISSVSDQELMLKMLLEERQRELFAEGKSWFDIMRIGIRDNQKYRELLTQQVLEVTGANNQAIIRSKLEDVYSWYLPYHERETSVNPLLKQNPYYEKLGK